MKALIKEWEIIRFLNDEQVITLNGVKQIILENSNIVSPKKNEEIVDVIPEPEDGGLFHYPNGNDTPAFVRKDIDIYDYMGTDVPEEMQEPTYKVYRYTTDPYVYEIYNEEAKGWFNYNSFIDRCNEI